MKTLVEVINIFKITDTLQPINVKWAALQFSLHA